MKAKTKDNLMAVFMLLVIVLALGFLILGIMDEDQKMEESCQNNCQQYGLPYLKSEQISYTGYACFCLDTDGKPREVPSQ